MLFSKLNQLGEKVERVWSARKGATPFADIATDLLGSADLPPFDWSEVEDQVLTAGNHSRFGDLNLMAYRGKDFYVELLVWGSSAPDIHSHAFSGAFRVVEGGSVHARYSVEREVWRSEVLLVGEVHLHALELLRPGQTRRIVPGPAFIHGLYHRCAPSATVVVRTYRDDDSPGQYGMPPPGHGEVVTLTQADRIFKDGRMKALRRLAGLVPRAQFGAAVTRNAAELSPSRAWLVREEFRDHLSPTAITALDGRLPDALLDQRHTPRKGVLRLERKRLRTDVARTVAGVLQYAPDLATALDTLEGADDDRSGADLLADGLVEVFSNILREDGADGLAGVVVREVLQGGGLHRVFATLREDYTDDSVAALAPQIEVAYRVVAGQLQRILPAP